MDNPEPVTTPEVGVEASTQPIESVEVAAEQPQEPQSQSQPAQADDEYAAWLQSKGLEPDSDAAKKAAQMAYNSEKLMTKATQEASELKKSLMPEPSADPQTFADPALADISNFAQEYKRDKQLNAFKEAHTDWSEHEPAMVNILQSAVETPYGAYTRSQLVNMGVLTLDDVYTMAKGSAPVNTEAIKSQAQQEVLQTLANTQRAGGANAHATNAAPVATKVTSANVESWYAGLSPSERAKPENQKILSSL